MPINIDGFDMAKPEQPMTPIEIVSSCLEGQQRYERIMRNNYSYELPALKAFIAIQEHMCGIKFSLEAINILREKIREKEREITRLKRILDIVYERAGCCHCGLNCMEDAGKIAIAEEYIQNNPQGGSIL